MEEPPQDAVERQDAALLAWLNSLDLEVDRDPARGTIATWADPAKLFRLCQSVDSKHFSTEDDLDTLADSQERLEVLQELYSLILDYLNGNLRTSTASLPSAKLESIAKNQDVEETRSLLNIILAMSVMSPGKEHQVSHIQTLPQWAQAELMQSIKDTRAKMPSPDPSSDRDSSGFATRSSDDSLPALAELQAAHRQVQEAYGRLSKDHDTLVEEHASTLHALREAESQRLGTSAEEGKLEASLRAEVDRLQKELSRTETIISDSEKSSSKQSKELEDLTKRVEDLSVKADQADRLNDQVDELKHAAEKARKLENVIEKYKKKLQDAAEAKRMVKALEDENLALLEKHTALEEEHQKVQAYKPLMDSCKATIADLEGKVSKLNQEKSDQQFQLDERTRRLEGLEADLAAEKGAVSLLEERLAELEQAGRGKGHAAANGSGSPANGDASVASDGEDDANNLSGIADELDSALTGRTTTDLKLQIRKLTRELQNAQANKADASKLVVLENLLEDSKRMKARYEEQYLSERRERLSLESKLEKIRNGGSGLMDGADVAMALRIRLNETVEELDRIKEAQVTTEQELCDAQRNLHIVKSDLSLVDQDQLTVLARLRDSVSQEKAELEAGSKASQVEIAKLKETTAMQSSQINTLLMDKVNLQGTALEQRDQALGNQANDAISSQSTLVQLEALRSEAASRQQELDQTKEKLLKARQFIREQDRLFKEQHANSQPAEASFGSDEEAYKAQIEALQAALSKQQALNDDIENRYQREMRYMTAAWQARGMQTARGKTSEEDQPLASRKPSASWLAQQRAN